MRAPYYQDEAVTLYQADALDILTEMIEDMVLIDAVVCDPPYASGTRTEMAKASSGAMVRGARWANRPIDNDQITTVGYVWLMREIAYRSRVLLPDGGSFCAFVDWRSYPNLAGALETVNLRLCGLVVWDKRSFGMGNGFRRQHELMIHAAKGVPDVWDLGRGDVLSHSRDTDTNHPAPKPVPLMKDILRVVCPAGGVVLDPFAGAGSTLLAAKELGMKAIGIEVDPAHCKTAADRLSQKILDFEPVESAVPADLVLDGLIHSNP